MIFPGQCIPFAHGIKPSRQKDKGALLFCLDIKLVLNFAQGTLISDVFHIVGFYPHDSKLLRKYESASARGSDSNPFTFTSLSKLMSCQGLFWVTFNFA